VQLRLAVAKNGLLKDGVKDRPKGRLPQLSSPPRSTLLASEQNDM
jgi:hypothetical protein